MRWKMALLVLGVAFLSLSGFAAEARAAGTLTDAATGAQATIVDHQVKVVLADGFARTEVTQVFDNSAATPIDAIYEFPVPPDAALSQMKIVLADRTLNGEVVPREQAESIYAQEKASGNQAGIATKDGHQNFRFAIANVPPKSQATMSFVYYEKLAVDDAVGRYLYPLQDGGTSAQPWVGNQSAGSFGFELELKSTMPIESLSMPGLSPEITQLGYGHYRVRLTASPAELSKDLVLEYRFPDDSPRRLEVFTHRPHDAARGTFMLVLTPGVDLAPITAGTDYVFVVDVSGSMASKMYTLRTAAAQALAKLSPNDRFRILAFDDHVVDLTGGFLVASAANVSAATSKVQALVEGGGTDLYAALEAGLVGLDADRVTSTLLLTDAETNTGIVDPVAFDTLLRRSDVRVYGLLLSNNANWPLMGIVSEASGGFYTPVSNEDDIAGQVQRAYDKATHQALHDVALDVGGSSVHETTEFRLSKIYKGQQLVIFGRYDQAENALLTLSARASGQPVTIAQQFHLPAQNPDNAVLERLWALDMIHAIERQNLLGLLPDAEAKDRIVKLGVEYQLVTDYTAMIVIDDATFEKYGLEQTNQSKIDAENGGYSGGGYGGSSESKFGGALDAAHFALAALLALCLGALSLGRRRQDGVS